MSSRAFARVRFTRRVVLPALRVAGIVLALVVGATWTVERRPALAWLLDALRGARSGASHLFGGTE